MNFPSLTWLYIYIPVALESQMFYKKIWKDNTTSLYCFVPDIIQLKQQISVFTIMFYLEKHMKILLLDNLFVFLRVKYTNRCIMA